LSSTAQGLVSASEDTHLVSVVSTSGDRGLVTSLSLVCLRRWRILLRVF